MDASGIGSQVIIKAANVETWDEFRSQSALRIKIQQNEDSVLMIKKPRTRTK